MSVLQLYENLEHFSVTAVALIVIWPEATAEAAQ